MARGRNHAIVKHGGRSAARSLTALVLAAALAAAAAGASPALAAQGVGSPGPTTTTITTTTQAPTQPAPGGTATTPASTSCTPTSSTCPGATPSTATTVPLPGCKGKTTGLCSPTAGTSSSGSACSAGAGNGALGGPSPTGESLGGGGSNAAGLGGAPSAGTLAGGDANTDSAAAGNANGDSLVSTLLGGSVGDLVGSVTCGVFHALFNFPTADNFGSWLLTGLLATPNYAQQGTNLSLVASNTSAIGIGLLGATMTFAIIQYWLSGMIKGAGGMSGAEGIARAVGAAVLIVLWPWAFGQAVAVANSLSAAVVNAGAQSDWSTIFQGLPITGASGVPLIISGLMAVFAVVMMLFLLVLKIAMSSSLAVAFVAMPIMVALWVVPSLSWLAAHTVKGLVVILTIPLVWAVIFVVFTAFAFDTLTFGNLTLQGAGYWGTILRPLVTLCLLLMLIFLPLKLVKLAAIGTVLPGAGSTAGVGMLGRIASSAMGRTMSQAMGSVVPGLQGGSRGDEGGRKTGGDPATQPARTSGGDGDDGGQGTPAWGDAARAADIALGAPPADWSGGTPTAGSLQSAGAISKLPSAAARERGAAISRADEAFGGARPVDGDKLQGSLDTAKQALSQYRDELNDPDPDAVGAAFEGSVADARSALSAFSEPQQRALADVFQHGGADAMAAYAAHQSYSQDLTFEQRDAAITLAGSDEEVLEEALPAVSSEPAGWAYEAARTGPSQHEQTAFAPSPDDPPAGRVMVG